MWFIQISDSRKQIHSFRVDRREKGEKDVSKKEQLNERTTNDNSAMGVANQGGKAAENAPTFA